MNTAADKGACKRVTATPSEWRPCSSVTFAAMTVIPAIFHSDCSLQLQKSTAPVEQTTLATRMHHPWSPTEGGLHHFWVIPTVFRTLL